MKSLEIEGARAPVPHSWRRHRFYYRATNVCVFVCDFVVSGKRRRELMDGVGRTSSVNRDRPIGPVVVLVKRELSLPTNTPPLHVRRDIRFPNTPSTERTHPIVIDHR